MKLLLIYPDIKTIQFPHFHHGLAWISAVAKKGGHDVGLMYLDREIEDDEFVESVRSRDPDIVGFSSTTQQFNFTRRYAGALKERLRKLLVIGGIHATSDPEGVMSHDIFDVLARSEGEYPVLELLEALKHNRDYSGIANLWVRMPNGETKRNPQRPPVNLADLPWPDRDLFDNEALMEHNDRQVSVMAARGCPFKCSYCSNTMLLELAGGAANWVRQRALPDVIAELEFLHRRFPDLKSLIFMDEIFTLRKTWVKEFCEEYRARFQTPFQIFLRIETVDREMMEWMRRAGLYSVIMGVESGNEKIRREVLNRKMTDEQIIRVFKWADELGIETWDFNMIGVPGDTEATIRETMELNKIIRPHHVQVSIFYPFPSTPLFDRALSEGCVKVDDNTSYFTSHPTLDLPGLPSEKVFSLHKEFTALGFQIEAGKAAQGYADLTALFPSAVVEQGGVEYVNLWRVRIKGEDRMCILMHPPGKASYKLHIKPGSILRFGIAFSPDVWDKPGAGVTFEIRVKTRYRRERVIFSEYIDPKHRPNERNWLDRETDLSEFRGKTVTLSLLTVTPPGENQFCTVFWSRPSLNEL